MAQSKFGENLRRIRKEKGLTQKELAEMIMVAHSSISDWENGVSYPQVIWVYEIASKLCINPEDLVK
jgi:transcriptional regulator with XRE-family HTH domain